MALLETLVAADSAALSKVVSSQSMAVMCSVVDVDDEDGGPSEVKVVKGVVVVL